MLVAILLKACFYDVSINEQITSKNKALLMKYKRYQSLD